MIDAVSGKVMALWESRDLCGKDGLLNHSSLLLRAILTGGLSQKKKMMVLNRNSFFLWTIGFSILV